MRRILVTGGCGFIGSHFVRRLLQRQVSLVRGDADIAVRMQRPEDKEVVARRLADHRRRLHDALDARPDLVGPTQLVTAGLGVDAGHERATVACAPNSVSTVAANHHGGAAPIPLLWPHSGFSNGPTGSKRTQIPGEISFIVSMVRQSDTGTRCSRVRLPRNSNSRQ